MVYIRHIPSPPLDAYIDYFYYIDGSMPYTREKILPTGWLDLEVNLGGAIQIYDASGSKSVATCVESWWVGVWSTYGTVEWPLNIQLAGIHFKPGGAYPFLNFPLSELHNQIVSADAIWGGFAGELYERLCAAPSIPARLALFEQLLLTRLRYTTRTECCALWCYGACAAQWGTLNEGFKTSYGHQPEPPAHPVQTDGWHLAKSVCSSLPAEAHSPIN